jgi:DNA-binding MarR family transcriptional regulator
MMVDVEAEGSADTEARSGEYRLQDQIGFILRKAHQRHIAIFAAHIGDLTPPQFAALCKLHDLGECSQNQLGQLIAMDAATIKGVIDRLKSRGLVATAEDREDRRRVIVSLTELGSATIVPLLETGQRISAETLGPLNNRETATLLRLLAKIT